MGAEITNVEAVEAPPLKPLSLTSRLAPTPSNPPKYTVTVSSGGEDVILADPNVTRGLVALMNVHAVHGGAACHWGGPAAFAEIMSAVHGHMFATKGRPWHEAFNFVNDAGHAENGVYALRANYGFDDLGFDDLKGFRGVHSKLTGHGESHLNPEGVLISNGPLGSSLPQAQGLAVGDKAAGNDRVTVCVISDGASMEGEAKESFAAIPGLAAKGKVNPFVLVVSDNNTKLSGRIDADAFKMQPTFEAMSALGWHVVHVENGHDLGAVHEAVGRGLELAKGAPEKPVCLWVKTIKGYGVKSTEEHAAGGHGFPLKGGHQIVDFVDQIFDGKVPTELADWAKALEGEYQQKQEAAAAVPKVSNPVKTDKVQAGLARGAIRAAKEGLPVYSVSSDVQGSTGIATFQKSFPDRFLEVGIAEANMISTGAGMAKAGFIPIVDTFGQFGVTKGNLPLTMAALSQAPVIAIFSHVGFQDAADGASHQATTYLSATSAIPHTAVIAPSCADEAEALMYEAIRRYADDRSAGKDGDSYLFFVGRENYPTSWIENASYPWGKAQIVQDGNQVVLIGCGQLVSQAIAAGQQLAENGVSATVINNPFVNRVDIATIGEAVKRCGGKVVTIEDHQKICGMGAQVSHTLSTHGIEHSMISLGIENDFGQSAYMAAHLYEKHKMMASDIVEAANKLIG